MDIIMGLAIFASGLLLGSALYHVFFAKSTDKNKLTQALDEVQAEHANYQNNVDLHFQKMAKLVNNLTNSYSEVHQHLTEGAQNLSQHPMPSKIITQQIGVTPHTEEDIPIPATAAPTTTEPSQTPLDTENLDSSATPEKKNSALQEPTTT